ncbi:hypothetical protein MHI12_06620 [Paenibacillus sp. FSL H8-0280]|uniref:hypothetical protein n=1 Tax=Paenibacillus sp. FSL H8-0280 TaxID=2921382 RepID=UPI003246FAFD
MATISSGPIENNLVSGSRLTQSVTVKIDNEDPINASNVLIEGYALNGTRTFMY